MSNTMTDSPHAEVLTILADVLLEVETSMQTLDFGDPSIETFGYIMSKLDIVVAELEAMDKQ